MTGIAIFVTLSLLAALNAQNVGKDFCKNMLDGNYINPYNCNRYVVCSGQKATDMKCPKGLYFSEKLDQCDWPTNVKCNPKPVPTASSASIFDFFCLDKAAGLYPDPNVCSRYYYCDGNGNSNEKNCPKDTNFHPGYSICVWKGTFSCKGSNFCQGKKDGNYRNSDDCSTYYACAGGLTYKMDCPSNLFYNPGKDQCDDPAKVDCKSHHTPTQAPTTTAPFTQSTKSPQTSPSPSGACAGKSSGSYPDSLACNKFHVCDGKGGGHVKTCPDQMNFFPPLGVCVWDNTFTCNGPNFCLGKKDGNYQNLNDCGTFYACSGGLTHVMECPKGLWFNLKKNQCDYPKNVDCKPTSTSSPATTAPVSSTALPTTVQTTTAALPTTAPVVSTTPASASFCVNKPFGYYPDPVVCSRYYVCDGRDHGVERNCRKTTNYNPKLRLCVWASTYSCLDTNFCLGKKDGDYQNIRACGTYYACSNELTYNMPCAAGLWFNPSTKKCDYPENVSCPGPTTPPQVTTTAVPTTQVPSTQAPSTQVPSTQAPSTQAPTQAPSTQAPVVTTTGSPQTTSVPTQLCIGKPAGNYPDDRICSVFYVCDGNGNGVKKTCPAKTNYYPKMQVCVWARTYSCVDNNFCIGKKDGNYQNVRACGTYYACVNGLTYDMACPANQRFDPKTNQCDQPSKVQCGNSPSLAVGDVPYNDDIVEDIVDESVTEKRSADPISVCVTRPVGMFPSPRSCSEFFICFGNGSGKAVACPEETVFYPKMSGCVPEETFSCSVPNFCLQKKDGNYQNPGKCDTYYACVNGLTYVMNCQDNLWYNPKTDQCDYQSNVECEGPTTPPTTTQTITLAAKRDNIIDQQDNVIDVKSLNEVPVCEGKAPGMYPSPNSCSEYYVCTGNNKGKSMPCAPLTVYDPNLQGCVWENMYSCADPGFCEGKKDGNYQNVDKCNTYVSCANGLPYVMDCPEELYYNPATDQCDQPENVQCAKNEKRSLPGTQKELPSPLSCIGKTAGAYEDPLSCQQFILCNGNGSGKVKTCPKNTNFHPKYKVCVWAYLYSCSDPNFCEHKEDGNYKNLNNCFGYYACVGGLTYSMACPKDLVFDGKECAHNDGHICI